MAAHCETSGVLSLRLGLGPSVRDPLQQAYERWDGKGSPAELAGTAIAQVMRIVHIANDVEALHRIGGVDAAVEMLRDRRGTEFDPELVDRFCAHADELLASMDELDGWDSLISGRAALERQLGGRRGRRGARGVRRLRRREVARSPSATREASPSSPPPAATSVGLPAVDVSLARRAALVHDVGTIGVSAGILDKPGHLTDAERERIRTHPYLTARTFSKPRGPRRHRACSPPCTTSGWTARATRRA